MENKDFEKDALGVEKKTENVENMADVENMKDVGKTPEADMPTEETPKAEPPKKGSTKKGAAKKAASGKGTSRRTTKRTPKKKNLDVSVEKALFEIAKLTGACKGYDTREYFARRLKEAHPGLENHVGDLTEDERLSVLFYWTRDALAAGEEDEETLEARAKDMPAYVRGWARWIMAEYDAKKAKVLASEHPEWDFHESFVRRAANELAFDLDDAEGDHPFMDAETEEFLKEEFSRSGVEWDLLKHRRECLLRFEDERLFDKNGGYRKEDYEPIRREYDRMIGRDPSDDADVVRESDERNARLYEAIRDRAAEGDVAGRSCALILAQVAEGKRPKKNRWARPKFDDEAVAAKFWLLSDVFAGKLRKEDYPGDFDVDVANLDEYAGRAEVPARGEWESKRKAIADSGLDPRSVPEWRAVAEFRLRARRATLNAMLAAERMGHRAFTRCSAWLIDNWCPYVLSDYDREYRKTFVSEVESGWYDGLRFGVDGVAACLKRQADACREAGDAENAEILEEAAMRSAKRDRASAEA